MDHDFVGNWCKRCGVSRTELIAYGHPDVKLEPGDNTGLSCSERQPGGSLRTNESEIASLRAAWKRDREQKWDRMFG
jgi:hypothetical protein